MRIKILCIGDVVGQAGRAFLSGAVPVLRKAYDIDLVVANAENIAGGSGLTPQAYDKLKRYGVDVITLGDHCYKRREAIPLMQSKADIVRPANLPPGALGRASTVVTTASGVAVGVTALIGRLYMKPADCPLRVGEQVISQLRQQTRVTVVDMHAEATSEKISLGWHLDGKASIVFGTHTHVPTADAMILPNGTAYLTDLGMTGPYNSVLGRETKAVLKSLISGVPTMYGIAKGDLRLGAMMATVDVDTGRALDVKSLFMTEKELVDIRSTLTVPLPPMETDDGE